MRDPGQFDAFYAAARQRLLLQAFALTGDLGAAKHAVRDGFVAAWHHWHKVSWQGDPEAWVRPFAWQHAQRRHTTHFWHREGSLAPGNRATLDALAELTTIQRRALILHVLAGLDAAEFSHEIGLTPESAARQLRLALAQFAIHRDIDPSDVGPVLHALGDALETVRLPRASIIRRTGTARRRTHTSAAVAATAALVLGVGFTVSHDATLTASLTGERGTGPGVGLPVPDAVVHLRTSDLLTGADVATLAARPLTETGTGDNTEGDGLILPCQTRRFADPEALATLVREFEAPVSAKSGRSTGLRQVTERSADANAGTTAYDETLAWFSDCAGRRMQLLQTHALTGAGDAGALLVLRDWKDPVTTWTIGVARTGSIVTVLARDTADARGPELPPFVAALGRAVNRLCAADGGGTCATTPRKTLAPPPPGPSAPGLLQAVDLPSVAGVPRTWVGTNPKAATTNPAATTCDRAQFTGADVTWSATRTFLMPEAKLPAEFGLTETAGRFRTERKARGFLDAVEKRMGGCEDRDLTATVDEIRHRPQGPGELHAWRLRAELSDNRSIDFWVAFVRRGAVIAQVTFVPVDRATIGQDGFIAVAERALARLAHLPPA